ncbi:MAG: 1-acyl-sn-glycerol-3-phosphate acyltransferase [Candidatus Sumerlaeia bacterium]|nr:1-acyl-sn-glycerol-3-phosphate acyltransferase [Candidatus Sumerlaeia bacterium]
MTEKKREKLPEEYFSAPAAAITTGVVFAILKTFYGFKVTGMDRCPTEGPVIIAPNHTCFLDPPVVTCSMRRPVHYIAGAWLFKAPLFGGLIRRLGAVPVDLGKSSDKAAYEASLRLLQRGRLVCLYPEGTRTYDGKLAPLKPGVGRLAVATGAPIVPLTIHGGYAAWPRSRKFPKIFKKITSEVHEPIWPGEVSTGPEKRQEAARMMAELERVLRKGLGELPGEEAAPSNPEQSSD